MNLKDNIRAEIKADAIKQAPCECCGLICLKNGEQILLKSNNLATDKINNFVVDYYLYLQARDKNYQIIGFYHSHSRQKSEPHENKLSQQDILVANESCLFSCVYDLNLDQFIDYEPKICSIIDFECVEKDFVQVQMEGGLGLKFGKFWNLDAANIKEIFSALNTNTNFQFLQYLQNCINNELGYCLIYNDEIISIKNEEAIDGPLHKDKIYILPIITGNIYGIDDAIIYQILIQIAISAISMAISYLLQPTPPKISANVAAPIFNNGPSPAIQGTPVPMGYGELIIWPTTASVCFNYSHLFS